MPSDFEGVVLGTVLPGLDLLSPFSYLRGVVPFCKLLELDNLLAAFLNSILHPVQ